MRSTAPITVRPSRRLMFAAAAVIIGLSACGDLPEGGSASDLPVIALSDSRGAAPAEAGAMADEKMMALPYWNIDYVWAGQELGVEAATGYRYEGTAGADALARLAAALGVAGDPVALSADQGGGWTVGPQDGTAPAVTLSADGLGSWWYNSAYALARPAVECVTPLPADDPASSIPVGDGSGTVSDTPCAEPTPPEGVPTEDEARAKVLDLLAQLGVDAGSVELEIYADDWSAGATVFPMVDGARSQMAWSFGFGEQGSLQYASGSLFQPVAVGDYPLISCEEGVARLNEQQAMWSTYGGPAALSSRGGAADAGVAAPEPMPVDPALIDPAAPVDTTPVIVELGECRLDRTPVWAQDGTVWLLPAYTYTGNDGGQYSVLAVDDQYVETPTTEVPTTEVPVTEVPVTEVPVTEVPNTVITEATLEGAQVLVGLPIADAEKLAAESGWTVRILRQDGEDLAGTMDVRPERVNVEVTDGVVVAVLSVG